MTKIPITVHNFLVKEPEIVTFKVFWDIFDLKYEIF